MKDRSIKYSEAYIKEKTEELRRDFTARVSQLQQRHGQAQGRWKNDPSLMNALNAAYQDELGQLKQSFRAKASELQDELNLLIESGSDRFRHHLDFLQQGIRDIFRMISQSAVVLSSITLLRPEHFFK